MFKAGTKLYWKASNQPAYEKLDDEDFGTWVSLDSKYLVRKLVVDKSGKALDKSGKLASTGNEQYVDVLKPESEKPLYRNGQVNRFGFRWTDQQVYAYFNSFMNFVH